MTKSEYILDLNWQCYAENATIENIPGLKLKLYTKVLDAHLSYAECYLILNKQVYTIYPPTDIKPYYKAVKHMQQLPSYYLGRSNYRFYNLEEINKILRNYNMAEYIEFAEHMR